jgi:hypothetical protein
MASKNKKIPEKEDDSSLSEFIQRFKAKPFVFIGTFLVLILIIIAFVFLPAIVPNYGQGIDLIFGSYNKIPINYVAGNYFYEFQQDLAQQYQTSSLDAASYLDIQYYIWRRAFEATVVNTAILDEMKRAGYVTPDDVVDTQMAMLSEFQENGRFSINKFRAMNNNVRMSLWRKIRDAIAVDYYTSDLTGLLVPAGETAFITAMGSPERSFDMVSFSIYAYPDSEIEAYVRAFPDMFRIAHFSRITVYSGEREARQILNSIQSGADTFENAARNMSRDTYADNSGNMGNRMIFELSAEIPSVQLDGLLTLPRGSLSDVIRLSNDSWAIFRVEETAQQADIQDYATMDKIRNYMMTYQRGRIEDWLLSEAEVFVEYVKAVGFDIAAADMGFYKESFGPLPLNYGNTSLFPSVSRMDISALFDEYSRVNAGTNDRFWQAAFTTPLHTPSTPIVIGTNVVVLYPYEESEADEYNNSLRQVYFSSTLLPDIAYSDIQYYFLMNPKLDNQFEEIFYHLFLE